MWNCKSMWAHPFPRAFACASPTIVAAANDTVGFDGSLGARVVVVAAGADFVVVVLGAVCFEEELQAEAAKASVNTLTTLRNRITAMSSPFDPAGGRPLQSAAFPEEDACC
jgi:hypothetical protein